MRKIIVLSALLFLCTACATTSMTPELRRRAARVRLLEPRDAEERPYLLVGEVKGVSCGRQLGSDPSIQAAREKLKLEAAKLGAEAVVDILCEETGVDWAHNCWKAIHCSGDAVTFRGLSKPPGGPSPDEGMPASL
jgi:hypothetical protein